MACKTCGSERQEKFPAEVAIHLKDLDAPLIFVFPELSVCLQCGAPEFPEGFVVPEGELKFLAGKG